MKIQRQKLFSESWQKSELLISYDGYVTTDQTWKQDPLPTSISRLYYVMEGSGMLLTEEEEMRLEPGYVYLAPCGVRCGYYGTDSITKIFFHINVVLPDGYDLFSSCRRLMRLERSGERMRKLLSWYASGDAAQQTLVIGEIWETIAECANRFLVEHQRHYGELVKKAIGYIRSHLRAGLTVKEVAEAVFCSVSRLGESFRREMGITVAQYIEDLVMFKAQRLLTCSEKNVGEISAELGFCDQFYFSRRFQKRFLVSPREYRKMQAKT